MLGELRSQRRGPRHDVLDRGEVALVHRRVLGERQRDRRHDEGPRDAVLLNQVEKLLEVEARHGDDRRAAPKALVQDHGLPVDVEEGQDADQDVVLGDLERVLDLHQVRDQVLVGEHHALGQPRRAARVRQDRQVVAGDLDARAPRAGSPINSDSGVAPSASPTTKTSSTPAASAAFCGHVQERRDRQEELRTGVLELVLELAGRVERVHRRGLAAGARRRRGRRSRTRAGSACRRTGSRPARSRARRARPPGHGSPGRAPRR